MRQTLPPTLEPKPLVQTSRETRSRLAQGEKATFLVHRALGLFRVRYEGRLGHRACPFILRYEIRTSEIRPWQRRHLHYRFHARHTDSRPAQKPHTFMHFSAGPRTILINYRGCAADTRDLSASNHAGTSLPHPRLRRLFRHRRSRSLGQVSSPCPRDIIETNRGPRTASPE